MAINPALFRMLRDREIRVHELSYLFWECTTRCNFRCRHCGSDCGVAERGKDMPAEDFLAAVDTIPAARRPDNFIVVLTGGEPLLRPDILDIGKEFHRRGIQWGMVSNGWLYDDEMHLKLVGAGMAALTVSLDGLEGSHEWMRGVPGSYGRAVRAVKAFAREPRLASDVVTCVNKRNLAELPAMYEMLQGFGLKQWRMFTVIPIGRAASDSQMHLTDAEFTSLMDFIKERRELGGPMKVTFSCEGYLGRYEQQVRDTPYFCHAGVNIASVLADGRICACPNIDRDRFSQGNIYSDSLWQVWQERFSEFRDRSWARTGRCRGCSQWRNCLGGGMHNRHGGSPDVLQCHYAKTLESDIA